MMTGNLATSLLTETNETLRKSEHKAVSALLWNTPHWPPILLLLAGSLAEERPRCLA